MARIIYSLVIVCAGAVENVTAGDWPMWRFDASRSAASPDSLPKDLRPAWTRDCPPNHVAWQEDPRIQFDAGLQPIVIGQTMLVGSSQTDSITALDTRSGQQKWRFYADGPVRLAPVAWRDHVYFGADDGYFYCLRISNGELAWKFRAAPSGRMVLGNERLISVWPIRGGPVLDRTPGQEKLYFTAGVWPLEGVLLYAVDLQESPSGSPHYTTKSLHDITPQGHLVWNGGRLYIPAGRAKATCLDLASGETKSLNYDSRGLTDFHVASAKNLLFHGAKVYHTELGRMMPFNASRPVSDGQMVYCAEKGFVQAYDMSQRKTTMAKDRKGRPVSRDQVPMSWRLSLEKTIPSDQPPQLHIRAGKRLYGNRGKVVFALDLPDQGQTPKLTWKQSIEGHPTSMLAADSRLFVTTRQGRIHCFADHNGAAEHYPLESRTALAESKANSTAKEVLQTTGKPHGYCLVLGVDSGDLALELAAQSDLRIIVVDADSKKVQRLRRRAAATGQYGIKLAAIQANCERINLPPYLASLIVSENLAAELLDRKLIAKVFNSLRPYGGSLAIRLDDDGYQQLQRLVKQAGLPKAKLIRKGDLAVLSRDGALPGAADWTHEYGDAANTLMSMDLRVKAPLGVLWFGGPAGSGELYFNRHYWGPGLVVVEGKMFVQGPERLAAIDIYTGRVLWKRHLIKGYSPGRRGNFFEKEKPGFHFVAEKDSVYLVYPEVCLRLDPETGNTLAEFDVPTKTDRWGKMRVWNNLLIATVFRQHKNLGMLPSAIAAINRHTGEVAWIHNATQSVPLTAVGGDKVFFFDGVLSGFYDAWKRKGLVPKSLPQKHLKALDVRTGKPIWESTTGRAVTWMGYSHSKDILVISNKRGIEGMRGATGQPLWKNQQEAPGFGGHPENVWDKVILADDLVIDQRGPGSAFDITTGKPAMDRHPITGKPIPWRFTKTGHHCNYAIASPHLLTFRAGTAGFFDRKTKGSSRLLGFRSGCRNSLIPAGGVLNAPNYAHGCICSYHLFTSLALVHTPKAELWTYNAFDSPKSQPSDEPQRMGINFGAPGDRVSSQGTLWMEFPHASEPSARVTVEVKGMSAKPYRLLSQQIQSDNLRWVASCGLQGMSQVRVAVPGDASKDRLFTVRLLFAEPQMTAPGKRVFDVSLQGTVVLQDLDIVQEAGKRRTLLVKEFSGINVARYLDLEFTSKQGEPLLCGVEVVAE